MKSTVTGREWAPAGAGGPFDRSVTAPNSSRFQVYEYAYYFIVFYALMGSAVGISFGSLGIAMHAVLALLCIFRLRSGTLATYRPLMSILVCSVWVVGVQVLIHGSPVTQTYIRPFFSFILALIIVKSLCARPGFLGRALIAIFIMELTVLPFLELTGYGDQASLTEGVLRNPNDLAAWFGFCAVAFLVRGLETRRSFGRWVCWGIALLSIFIVGLTVGRGALIAFTVSALVAFRKRLKRGFLPVLAIVVLGGIAFAYGLFDHEIVRYMERGTEDTGRFPVWVLVVPRLLQSPLLGVPVSEFGTTLDSGGEYTPHNGLLFIALTGGVVPLLFFLAHWVRCLRGALRPTVPENPDSVYLLPLLVYSFLIVLQLNQAFISTWFEVISCACLQNLAVRHWPRISALKSRLFLKRRRQRELVTSKV